MTQPQTILSRADAIELHSKTYFTGKPCGRGHVAKRYTSTGNCVECSRAAAQTFNDKLRGRLRAADATDITLRVHPDDREALFALADFLNVQRGRPAHHRPAPPPPITTTEWEQSYERHRRTKSHAMAVQYATTPERPETHSPGWSHPDWGTDPVANSAPKPPSYGGGAQPAYLK